MSKEDEEAGSAALNSCPLCDSDRFTWGMASGHYPFTFKPDKASWFSSGLKIMARRCDSCGNIQLFVAPE